MKRRLDELPEELVSNISVRLHADDISALRLSCRALEHKTFHEFATEYFTEKGFVITTDSLKALVAIASSEKLKGYLQHVHFLTVFFSGAAFSCPNGCNCAWQPSVRQREAFCTYQADQKSIRQSDCGKDLLQQAFAALPALKTVNIVDSASLLPADVDYRGKNKIRRLTGREPMFGSSSTDDKQYDEFVRHVWKSVMDALAGSKMTALNVLGAQLSRGMYGLSIVPDMQLLARPEMTPVFANLKTVTLRLRTSNPFKKGTEASRKKEKSDGIKAMKDMAKSMPALSLLDLAFDSGSSSGLYFARLAQNLNLQNLSNLYLRSLYIQAASLGPVLCKLGSVKDLRLTFINLTKGSWVTILKAISKLTDHLTHLHLMYLLEGGQKAYFLKQEDPEEASNNDFLPGDFIDDDDLISDEEDSSNDSDDDVPDLEPVDGPFLAELISGESSAQQDSSGNESGTDSVQPPLQQQQIPILPEFADLESGNPPSPNMPLDQFIQPTPSVPSITANPGPPDHAQEDYIAPNDPGHGERGYYVCVKGDQIAAQLLKFIEEYNVGNDIEDDLDGLGGPGGFGDFLNSLGAALGAGPPPYMGGAHPYPPAPAATGGNAGNHGTNAANTTTNAAPPGVVSTGTGGYAAHLGNGVILGTGPLPAFLGPPPVGGPAPPPSAPAPPPMNNTANGGGVPADVPADVPANVLAQLLFNFVGMGSGPAGPTGGAHHTVDDMD